MDEDTKEKFCGPTGGVCSWVFWQDSDDPASLRSAAAGPTSVDSSVHVSTLHHTHSHVTLNEWTVFTFGFFIVST